MKRRDLIRLTIVCAVLSAGCASDLRHEPTAPLTQDAYLSASEPDNVIANLERAYANRDIKAYAELFAPEFVFRFQPRDAQRTGVSSWGRDDEIESARRLFTSPKVQDLPGGA